MSPEPGSALDWLYGTQLFGIKLGLENVHRLLAALDLPGRMKFIHVAGTNGKGSTCAFMHAILREAGINAGLFTSPHLIRFNERIQDSHRLISDEEIEAGLTQIRACVSTWRPHPTFFEITFALALDWFRRQGLEWAILETGLGGRLDATNAVTATVSVITAISLDHTEILGESLAAIAAEKAGIIKAGVPLITLSQDPQVQSVLAAVAARQAAPFTVTAPWSGPDLGLLGDHQRQNAALAVAALQAAGLPLERGQIDRGLAQARWQGRFQRLGNVILDGGHNPEAIRQLVNTWRTQFPGQKATVVFGAAREKEIAAMLRLMHPIVKEWRFTTFQSPRALPAESLAGLYAGLALPSAPVSIYHHPECALADAPDGLLLVTGSLFLVGETLAHLDGKLEKYRASGQ